MIGGASEDALSESPRIASESAIAAEAQRLEAWRSVPLWRPFKRYRAYHESRQSDPIFLAKSAPERLGEFLNDMLFSAAQPLYDEGLRGFEPIEEEAFLLPKQMARGRLTVLIDYRVLMQFYYDDQLGLITRKRPGADLFIERLAQVCDVVFVCDRTRAEVEQFMWRLDPLGRFSVRLYRQALYQKGYKMFKPMHKLGRNMARVILIDQSLLVSRDYVDNCIVLKPWGAFGLENTPDLVNLLPFLGQVARTNEDVRDQLRQFRKDEIYIPYFYHKVRELAHMAELKKQNPLAANIVAANLSPEFWDNGTMPPVDEWDDEPDSMIPMTSGGFPTRRKVEGISLKKAAMLKAGTYDPQADGLRVTREELLAGVKTIKTSDSHAMLERMARAKASNDDDNSENN